MSSLKDWADHLSAIFDGSRVPEDGSYDHVTGAGDYAVDQLVECGIPHPIACSIVHAAEDVDREVAGLVCLVVGLRLGRNPTPMTVPDSPPESP